MKNIGDSLQKKVGPLPIWIWSIIAFILVWYYRNKFSNSTTLATQSLTPTNALPPQTPVPLSPGESVYDPNTGALVNTPGAIAGPGDNGGGLISSIGDAMNSLADAIGNGMTVTTQPTPAETPPGTTAAPKTKSKRRITKRKPKNKMTKGQPKRPRSATHVKVQGRTRPRQVQGPTRGNSHTVTPAASSGNRTRNRPKTPMTTTVVRQRPVASHPTRPEAHNTPHQQHTSQKAPPRTRRRK